MKSGESQPSRGRTGGRHQSQGSLEGILPPDEPLVGGADEGLAEPTRAAKAPKRKPQRADAQGEGGMESLLASLDTLEENIKLLLARHESLAAAHAASEERRRSRESLDPIELQGRVRTLEADRERLERHAAFLEDRIRGLLSRVRYVIES
jgi:hypothetical protein